MAEVYLKGLDKVVKSLGNDERKTREIGVRALNKTAARTKTAGSREIRKEVRLPAGYVGERMNLVRANRGKLFAEIRAERRAVLLSRYSRFKPAGDLASARKTPSGRRRIARIARSPGKGAEALRHAFWVPIKRGHKQGGNGFALAERVKAGGGYARKKFEVLHGASVEQVWRTVRSKVEPFAADYLQKEFARLWRLALGAKK